MHNLKKSPWFAKPFAWNAGTILKVARDSEAQGGVLSENEREALGLDDAERVETEIMALISEVHIKKAIVL